MAASWFVSKEVMGVIRFGAMVIRKQTVFLLEEI